MIYVMRIKHYFLPCHVLSNSAEETVSLLLEKSFLLHYKTFVLFGCIIISPQLAADVRVWPKLKQPKCLQGKSVCVCL